MRYSVSDTAEYGDYSRGPRVVDTHVRENMKKVLEEVQSGKFAEEWIAENKAGRKKFLDTRAAQQSQLLEEVGDKLRSMMTFLKKKEVDESQRAKAPAGAPN
jgi:ketol-acid reductoisomerase